MSKRMRCLFEQKLPPDEAEQLLLDWFKVGDTFDLTPENPGVVVGFGKKFMRQGDNLHKHAGTYIDFLLLRIAYHETSQNPATSPWEKKLKNVDHYAFTGSIQDVSRTPQLAEKLYISGDATRDGLDSVFIRIDALPRYEFWVGDIVAFRDKIVDVSEYTAAHSSDCRMVHELEYHDQGERIDCWLINESTKIVTRINSPEDIVLIRRGNLWNLEHNEKLNVASIEEEAAFHKSLGLSQKLTQNLPVGGAENGVGFITTTNTEEWSMPDALRSVQNNVGHEIKIKDKKAMTFVVIKYDHAEFAARMRAHTLAKFGLAEETSA